MTNAQRTASYLFAVAQGNNEHPGRLLDILLSGKGICNSQRKQKAGQSNIGPAQFFEILTA